MKFNIPDVELEEINGSPYLTIAFERGKKEGAKIELEKMIDEITKIEEYKVSYTYFSDYLEKRLKELKEEGGVKK